MTKSPTGGRIRERVTFTIDRDFFEIFRSLCGLVPASRVVEELMRAWVDGRPPDVKHQSIKKAPKEGKAHNQTEDAKKKRTYN